MKNRLILLFIMLIFPLALHAQFADPLETGFNDDDLIIGGDIFSDFNEDLESDQILEDERFFKYGRFYSVNLGLGLTSFTGNRGQAYSDQHPTFNLSINAFSSFRFSFVLGVAYSKHSMFFNQTNLEGFKTAGAGNTAIAPGLIEVNILRTYTGFRYYIDTTDLGTALTYSNPYFTTRFEYWYVTNKFIDRKDLDDNTGGGVGVGIGGGFEFPIRLKEAYINYEFIVHTVNFHDRLTNNYQPLYQDLTGLGITNVVNYVVSW